MHLASKLIRSALLGVALLGALGPAAADVVVAQVAPFSGPLADTGRLVNQGAALAFREANEAGGIHGQKIRFEYRDDAYKVDETVRLYREMAASNKPVAYLGLVGTANLAALLKQGVIDEVGVPVIGVRTGAAAVRTPGNRLVYHLRASYADEVEKLVEVAVAIGGKRFGVVYQDDAFGQDGFEALKSSLARRGLPAAVSAPYERNTVKVEAAVEAMLKAGSLSAVVLVANTQATAAFVKAYRARGGLAQLYAMSVNNDRDIVEALGPEGARGLGIAQVVPFPYSDVLPVTRSYRKALRQYGEGAAPTMTGMEGYLYGRVLLEALRRAGPAASRESLQKALDSGPFELGGHVIQFGPNRREGSNFVELTIIGPQGKLIR